MKGVGGWGEGRAWDVFARIERARVGAEQNVFVSFATLFCVHFTQFSVLSSLCYTGRIRDFDNPRTRLIRNSIY